MTLTLREVVFEDVEYFFNFMQDEHQLKQAAFTPKDPKNKTAFEQHWKKIIASSETNNRTVLVDGAVVGNVGRWMMDDIPQLTYWVGSQFCGLGYATESLRQFLEVESLRPIEARCAFDNQASIRVLEKNGFTLVDDDVFFSNARGIEIKELIFRLP